MIKGIQVKRALRQKSDAFGIDAFIWLIALLGHILSVTDHRLFWRVCNVLGKLVPQGKYTCEITLNSDSVMKIYLDDPYWSRLVAFSYENEPEISRVLTILRDIPYVFVDCGANFGYWSIMASSKEMGSHDVHAIEASPETFSILRGNCTLNSDRFSCVNLAISDSTGRKVAIDSSSGHAGAHVTYEVAHKRHLVSTTTLDDEIRGCFRAVPNFLVVKLDVEGEEINGLKGAADLLNKDVLFCYEDHGKDPESRVTQYILEELGLTVLFYTGNGCFTRIHTAQEASRYKTRKNFGYNFFACKEQSIFKDRLMRIT